MTPMHYSILCLTAATIHLTGTASAKVISSNALEPSSTNLVTDSSGLPIPAGSGFVAIGSFDATTAELTGASGDPGAGAFYASKFTAVESVSLGNAGIPGVYQMIGESPAAGSTLVGKSIYTFVGNGTAPETSSAFLIYKHSADFSPASGGIFPGYQEAYLHASSGGMLLVGEFGTFSASAGPYGASEAFSLGESGSITIGETPGATTEAGFAFRQEISASADSSIFSLVEAPVWVELNRDGALTASPPVGTPSGDYEVVARVEGKGNTGVLEFVFSITVESSFRVWQERNFSLPAQKDIAGPFDDGDDDGLPNIYEYAKREEHREKSGPLRTHPSVNADGCLEVSLEVRDDDPDLRVGFETSGDLDFSVPAASPFPFLPALDLITGQESDAGEGMKQIMFTDPKNPSGRPAQRRFVRAVIQEP